MLHLPVAATGPELPHERCKPLRREKNKCKKKILGKENKCQTFSSWCLVVFWENIIKGDFAIYGSFYISSVNNFQVVTTVLTTLFLLLPHPSPPCAFLAVTLWVVVTHIVNPNEFYVRYITERKENEALSKKINQHCWRDGFHFALDDMLETGTCGFLHLSLNTFTIALRATYGPEMPTQRGAELCCCVLIWLHPSRFHDLRKVGRRPLVQGCHCGTTATWMCGGCEVLLGQPVGQYKGLLHWLWPHQKHQHTQVNLDSFWKWLLSMYCQSAFFFF